MKLICSELMAANDMKSEFMCQVNVMRYWISQCAHFIPRTSKQQLKLWHFSVWSAKRHRQQQKCNWMCYSIQLNLRYCQWSAAYSYFVACNKLLRCESDIIHTLHRSPLHSTVAAAHWDVIVNLLTNNLLQIIPCVCRWLCAHSNRMI